MNVSDDEENLRATYTLHPHHTGLEPISLILLSKHGLSDEPTPSLVSEASRWSTDVNMSVTGGQGSASSAAPGAVCSGSADVLSLQGVQDGQRCRSPLPAPAGDGKEERNSTVPQTARKNLTAHCWHQQDHRNQPYHGLTVCEAVPRVLTVWYSSQQASEPTGETAGTLCGSHFVPCADTNCSTSTSAASELTQFDLLLKRQTQRQIKLYSFVYHFHTTSCYSVEMARLGKTVDSLKNCNTKTPKNKLLCVLSKFTLVEWKESTELNHNSDAALGQCKVSSNLTW